MQQHPSIITPTPLRQCYERTRNLEADGQLRECVDLLEHPEIFVAEVLQSFRAVESAFDDGSLLPDVLEIRTTERLAGAAEPEWIYEGRDLSVLGDSCSFTCLSSHVDPLPTSGANEKDEVDGLDFAGITCNSLARPVLGTVQSEKDSSAFPLLLRGLAGLAEMAPAVQLSRMNHQYFKGALPPSPKFDLFLVTWYYDEEAERTPICEFTRDLADVMKRTIAEEADLAFGLNDIVCLRMNPARFDGRMRFDWRA